MHVNPRTLADLGPARLDRALRHARQCGRCRSPVERTMFALRTLEQGTPWEPTETEIATTARRGPSVIRGARRIPLRWPILTGLGFAGVALAALVWIRPVEFSERGTGQGGAVLRIFCATPAPGGLHELPPGGRCAGHALAFAAGARGELSSLALKLRDAEGTRILGPFTVTGQPGGETAVEATPELRGAGPLEVTGAFASSPEAAIESVRGTPAPGALILRQSALIEAR